METEGFLAPETAAAARHQFADLAATAEVVVKEVARATGSDAAYDELVTDAVILTAQEALFASLLEVTVATREEFDTLVADSDAEVALTGSENVERVVWHAPPFADRIVATTFADAREAAIGTLRRQAFAQVYRELVGSEVEET